MGHVRPQVLACVARWKVLEMALHLVFRQVLVLVPSHIHRRLYIQRSSARSVGLYALHQWSSEVNEALDVRLGALIIDLLWFCCWLEARSE